MSVSKTIVISCAGMGTRLGIGTTKALIDIEGKPLILRQLELLKDFDDIRIVVGYQMEKVIEVVNNYRKDILFVFNHNYRNTGTGGSFSLGIKHAREMVVSLDGDLLVHPDDLMRIMHSDKECACGTKIGTDNPMLMKTIRKTAKSYVQGFQEKKEVMNGQALHRYILTDLYPETDMYVTCLNLYFLLKWNISEQEKSTQ